jgi:response regulator RpfG family c-di-GMP phosphodiesterase
MNGVPTLLLLTRDPRTEQIFKDVVERDGAWRLIVTRREADALALARRERPQLVMAGLDEEGPPPLELCRWLRAEPELAGTSFVLLAAPGADTLKQAALALGADDFLTQPVGSAELLAKLRGASALRTLREQLQLGRAESERLQHTLGRGQEQLVELLVGLLETSRPGARARGERFAALALRLAERFVVPAPLLRDLELAGRLHELGYLTVGGVGGPEGAGADNGWRRAVAVETVLGQVETLKGAAEMVGGIYENWDGTGHPDRLQQGQIPLRCRILRAVLDFSAALERGGLDLALRELEEHVGTRYDPMVVVHLRAIVADESEDRLRGDRVQLPITDLRVGMVLAEDLYSPSGLKLLAAGTQLSPMALETILRRHRLEPISQGAAVRRRSAA